VTALAASSTNITWWHRFSAPTPAVSYVIDVIDRHRGPVIVDLTALSFCDAAGLGALVRMATCAQQAGRPFRLASPSPSLARLMRITGLDRKFLASLEDCPSDTAAVVRDRGVIGAGQAGDCVGAAAAIMMGL
jgi:anti-anti-sigma factor